MRWIDSLIVLHELLALGSTVGTEIKYNLLQELVPKDCDQSLPKNTYAGCSDRHTYSLDGAFQLAACADGEVEHRQFMRYKFEDIAGLFEMEEQSIRAVPLLFITLENVKGCAVKQWGKGCEKSAVMSEFLAPITLKDGSQFRGSFYSTYDLLDISSYDGYLTFDIECGSDHKNPIDVTFSVEYLPDQGLEHPLSSFIFLDYLERFTFTPLQKDVHACEQSMIDTCMSLEDEGQLVFCPIVTKEDFSSKDSSPPCSYRLEMVWEARTECQLPQYQMNLILYPFRVLKSFELSNVAYLSPNSYVTAIWNINPETGCDSIQVANLKDDINPTREGCTYRGCTERECIGTNNIPGWNDPNKFHREDVNLKLTLDKKTQTLGAIIPSGRLKLENGILMTFRREDGSQCLVDGESVYVTTELERRVK